MSTKCKCDGCRFIGENYQYGISIDQNLDVNQGYDQHIDDRIQRLGLDPRRRPPEEIYSEYPEDWVCAESRRIIAVEAIRRWTEYLEEVEQEIQDGGPEWRKTEE